MGWTDQRNKQNQQTATGYSIAKAMGSWLLVNDEFSADSALCWLCFCWRRHALLDPNTEVLQVSSRALHPCLSAKVMETVSIMFRLFSIQILGMPGALKTLRETSARKWQFIVCIILYYIVFLMRCRGCGGVLYSNQWELAIGQMANGRAKHLLILLISDGFQPSCKSLTPPWSRPVALAKTRLKLKLEEAARATTRFPDLPKDSGEIRGPLSFAWLVNFNCI